MYQNGGKPSLPWIQKQRVQTISCEFWRVLDGDEMVTDQADIAKRVRRRGLRPNSRLEIGAVHVLQRLRASGSPDLVRSLDVVSSAPARRSPSQSDMVSSARSAAAFPTVRSRDHQGVVVVV